MNISNLDTRDGSFPPTETDSDWDPWDGDPSLKWVQ